MDQAPAKVNLPLSTTEQPGIRAVHIPFILTSPIRSFTATSFRSIAFSSADTALSTVRLPLNVYLASPSIGKRRRVRPLKPSHFFARLQTRGPGDEISSGHAVERTFISEKVGMVGADGTMVHDSREDAGAASSALALRLVLARVFGLCDENDDGAGVT